MWVLWLRFCGGIFLLLTTSKLCAGQNSLESLTDFNFYNKYNEVRFVSTSRNDSLNASATGCDPSKRYALIVHGLGESCNVAWATELRKNLIAYRGGCIICMDYSAYSGNYTFLVTNFPEIAAILTAKLNALQDNLFSACTAYIFGFSVGARLAAQAGNDFGQKQIKKMHLCEPAGPLFDGKKNADPKLAAQDTQCIHTNAGGLGTTALNCDQDWLMGFCGESQAAARPYPNGNHGLCPVFYNSAFRNYFPAVKNPNVCVLGNSSRDALTWPNDGSIRMGYFQKIDFRAKYLNDKNFYANTTKDPPYTNAIY